MTEFKDDSIVVRVSTTMKKGTKRRLQQLAKNDNRSLSNYISKVMTKHAERMTKPKDKSTKD